MRQSGQRVVAALLAAATIVVLLAAPTGAAAGKPGRIKQKPSVSTDLEMRGTNGFRLDLFTLDRGGVVLFAHRGVDVNVSYFAQTHHPRGKRSDPDKLNFRIGHLGHFRGRFVPTSSVEENLEPGCEGDPPTIEKGYFVGSFRFRGERGYTAVHSRRLRGSVTRRPGSICTVPDGPPWHLSAHQARAERKRRHDEFHLVAADEKADIMFDARHREATKDEPEQTSYQASMNGKKVGAFRVSYIVSSFGFEPATETTFQAPNLSEPLSEATVAPPAPFSGSATFHLDDPKTASWTGDLAVDMPGLGEVPLTGEGIDAGLCKGSSCTKTLPNVLQPVLEAPEGVIVTVSVAKRKRDR